MIFNKKLAGALILIFLFFSPIAQHEVVQNSGQQVGFEDEQEAKTQGADLVIFSFDRPLQLRAYLESLQKYVTGLCATSVIYRTSSSSFEAAYHRLSVLFPTVSFIKQEGDPHQCFKPLLLKTIFETMKSPYLLFGVDDIVVTDFINMHECIAALEDYKAYGFYLRLGKNITQCYTLSVHENFPLPPLKEVKQGIYAWKFKDGMYDWNYPNSADMTLFRKQDTMQALHRMCYCTPNSLDVTWDAQRDIKILSQEMIGLCYEHSKMVNIPLNIVQENKFDRNMGFLTPQELLEEFNLGFKIDIHQFFKFDNRAPHAHCIPQFIQEDVQS